MSKVTFTYDPEADAVYIRLSRKAWAYTEGLDDQRHVDYAGDGTPIGIELLYVSDGVPADGLPYAELVSRVIQAADCLRKAGTSAFTRVTVTAPPLEAGSTSRR